MNFFSVHSLFGIHKKITAILGHIEKSPHSFNDKCVGRFDQPHF